MTEQSQIDLSEIIEPGFLEALLSVFSKRTRIPCAILDDKARPIISELNLCKFCTEIRSTELGLRRCRISDSAAIERVKKTGRLEFYVCPHGLVDFCAPIVVNGQLIAFFFGGQFRCSCGRLRTPRRPNLSELRATPDGAADRNTFLSSLESLFGSMPTVKSAVRFAKLKEMVSSELALLTDTLNQLHEWRLNERVRDFMAAASSITGVDDLLELTVRSLPDMMQAGASSIFLVQRDPSLNTDKLVLRKTTCAKLKPMENTASYDKGEGLTGWTWLTGRSLRISNLHNEAELAQYEGLTWQRKYNDSNVHTSFLAVPIGVPAVIGVIRVSQKRNRVIFNLHDEVFLTFLARHLEWAIAYSTIEDQYRRAIGLSTSAIKLASGLPRDAVLDAILASSLKLFGDEGKRHFINLLDDDHDHWRVERSGGNLPLDPSCRRRVFPLNQGATGRAIRTNAPLASSDLPHSEVLGEYFPAVQKGKAASFLVAPIRFGDTVHGAIAIVSDRRYGFNGPADLEIIEGLGKIAGAALSNSLAKDNELREREKAYSLFSRAVLHYLRNRHIAIEHYIGAIRAHAAKSGFDELRPPIDAVIAAQNRVKAVLDHFRAIGFVWDETRRSEELNDIIGSACKRTDTGIGFSPSGKPLYAKVDRFGIETVLCELLENALAVTNSVGDRVNVVVRSESDSSPAICQVEVTDSGSGVAEGMEKRIFEDRFTTGDPEHHVGLGLFIAKSIVEAHGGKIWLERSFHPGARFVFSLPLLQEGEHAV